MVQLPDGFGKFRFAVMATLRASQLTRGCVPRVEGDHCVAVTAQREVAEGHVLQMAVETVANLQGVPPAVEDAG